MPALTQEIIDQIDTLEARCRILAMEAEKEPQETQKALEAEVNGIRAILRLMKSVKETKSIEKSILSIQQIRGRLIELSAHKGWAGKDGWFQKWANGL
jgi:hypothetical protein